MLNVISRPVRRNIAPQEGTTMFGHTFASSRTRRFALLTALALVLVAAVPAVASATDLRSPDAQDQAVQSTTVDLRSPDVQDRGAPPVQAAPTASSSDGSVDWRYFAAGGLTVLLVGGGVVLMRRRRTIHATAAH
jgi:hypothetical protein